VADFRQINGSILARQSMSTSCCPAAPCQPLRVEVCPSVAVSGAQWPTAVSMPTAHVRLDAEPRYNTATAVDYTAATIRK